MFCSQRHKGQILQYIERIRNLCTWYDFCKNLQRRQHITFVSLFTFSSCEGKTSALCSRNKRRHRRYVSLRSRAETGKRRVLPSVVLNLSQVRQSSQHHSPVNRIKGLSANPSFISIGFINRGSHNDVTVSKRAESFRTEETYEQTVWYHGRGASELHRLHPRRSGV